MDDAKCDELLKSPKKRWKVWCARLALALTSVSLVLVAAEVILRIFSPGYSPLFLDIYAMDADGVLRLRPGITRRHVTAEWDVTVVINSEGLRDRAMPVSDEGGRVLAIGDSFAFGWGVEGSEAFPYVAEETLSPYAIRVVKAGVPGVGPSDQLLWLKREGEKYEPDLLVVGLFVGNDFADVQMGGVAKQYTIRDGLMVKRSLEPGRESLISEIKGKLKRSSLLAQKAAQLLWVYERRTSNSRERQHPGLSAGDRWLWEFFKIHLRDPPLATFEAFDLMLSTLDAIHDWGVQRNVPMLLLIIPRSFQIYSWELDHWMESYDISDGEIDLDRPQRLLVDWAARRGAAVLDLLPSLREYAEAHPDDRVYFYPNGHMNAAGHRITGRLLAESLKGLLVDAKAESR